MTEVSNGHLKQLKEIIYKLKLNIFNNPNWQGGLPVGYLQSVVEDFKPGTTMKQIQRMVSQGTSARDVASSSVLEIVCLKLS